MAERGRYKDSQQGRASGGTRGGSLHASDRLNITMIGRA